MSTNDEENGGLSSRPWKGNEPVAIVGIGCRMPGDIRGPSDFWNLLMAKGIARSDKVPKSRFNIDAYLHPENDRPGSFNVPGGFFLDDDLEAFDPSLFGISPVEAHCMDPQQRKILECVYEAFESSGTLLDDAMGKRTGCYIGCFTLDFLHMTMKEPDFRHSYTAMGVDTGLLANRINHVFDLKGPSITLNTACSSSLYALDLACKAIASGECESAIVGGVNLMMTVDQQMNTAKMGVLSPNSQSRPFDESADGYARAEGMGALFLKPLSAALRDGNPIRSVIRSTACTSNGRNEDGLSHPQGKGQKDAISLAYALGSLTPEETSYVECHGTGTIVGDPIEVNAIHEAMGAARPTDEPVLIGSVKANIGHSETASSIATLIKVTLALENGLIPPTAGITKLTSSMGHTEFHSIMLQSGADMLINALLVPWASLNVRVVTEPTPFPSILRRVGVNAFGYGGTNAHAILESVHSLVPGYHNHKSIAQAERESINSAGDGLETERPHLLLFSAHNRSTLENNLRDIARSRLEGCIFDLAYTLGNRRTKFEERAFAVVRKNSFTSDINSAAAETASNTTGKAIPAFVFTGQGAQWAHMGSYLIKLCAPVLQTIRSLDQYLSTLSISPSWSIEEVLLDPKQASLVDNSEYSQPLCTAIQIAIIDLLTRWNVKAVATIGHSSGEIAAAYAAGIISAESAITIAYFRGKVTATICTEGAMISVGIGADEAEKYIDEDTYRGRVVVACHNSPSSVTLSGDRDAIDKLKETFDRKKVFARILKTGGKAYHSHHMKQAASRYLDYLRTEAVSGQHYLTKVPMFSTVRSGRLQSSQDLYWVENLNNPVLFKHGIEHMLKDMPDINMLIEVGPHSALNGPLRQICQAIGKTKVVYLPTLKRQEHDLCQMLRLAGNLWIHDASIDIEAVTRIEQLGTEGSVESHRGSLLVDLPTYHWTYPKPTLAESRASKEHRTMKEPRHDILGRRVIGASPLEPLWRNVLCQKDLPWLAQHKLAGEVMLPATGYLALAIEAITQINSQAHEPLEIQSYTMRDVVISTATVVPDNDNGTETLFRLRPINGQLEISNDGKTSQWYEFLSSACSYGAWKEAARGLVALNIRGQAIDHIPQIVSDTPNCSKHIDWTDRGKELGFDFGPVFHHIDNVYTNGKTHTVRGNMDVSQDCGLMKAESRYVLHPTVLDSCLQPFPAMVHKGKIENFRCGVIPTHFGEFTVFQPSADQLMNKCLVQLWTDELGNRSYSSNIQLIGHDGALLVDAADCRCQLYPTALPQEMQGNTQRDLYTEYVWRIDSDHFAWAYDAKSLSDQPLPTLVDAILHKDVSTRVLCLNHTLIPDILAVRPDLHMTIGCSSEEEKNFATSIHSSSDMLTFVNASETIRSREKYNLIIVSDPDKSRLHELRGLMHTGGHLLLHVTLSDPASWNSILRSAGFSGVERNLFGGVIVTTATDLSPATNGTTHHVTNDEILLVYRRTPNSLHSTISSRLQQDGWKVVSQPISCIEEISCAQTILIADAEGPFLANLEEQDLKGLIKLTEAASAITWVTCGGLLTGEKPEYGMTAGAVQTIRKEKESLQLVTVDFDSDTTENRVADLLAEIMKSRSGKRLNGETDYRFQNGVVYIGRIISHRALNRDFVSDSGETTLLYQRDRPALKAQLESGKIVYRHADEQALDPLGADEVEVHVAAMGLSASDGADDSNFLSHEIVGTVTRVGSNVSHILPSSSVAGFAFERLSTFQRTSSSFVEVVPKEWSPLETATLPSAFVAALYGLQELARIQPGESVVILDEIGAVGQAIVQLCRVLDVNAIVVTTSPATEAFLRQNGQFSSTIVVSGGDLIVADQLRRLTSGRGVDVIFCSTDAEEKMAIECGRSLAPFGRMVTLGRADDYRSVSSVLSAGTLCLSFFQFDLANIMKHRPKVVARILKQCFELYKSKQIEALKSTTVKQPAEINHAIRSIPSDMGSGKYVVAYDEDAAFKVASSLKPLTFRDDANYLLVGCLGGLGRQVALWMAERGAKHLAFVSRSGIDNPASAGAVQLLKDRGVHAVILRADITNQDELARAVAGLDSKVPIRGVLNAASVFHDTLLSNMTIEAWKEVTDTKVKGSLNLHELLKDKPLDFFVMTSSVASVLGSSGQVNYSAANSMLNSLAHHRHALGLPAISLILPAIFGIGHISENRELEKAIQMKGMYGIRENEMLEAFEIALRPQAVLPPETHHIIVGLQPRRLGPAVRAAGAHVLSKENPSLNWMAAAVDEQSGQAGTSKTSDSSSSQEILVTLRQGGNREQAITLVTSYLSRRLGRILMIEEDSIQQTQKSVASHGLDSMIGAEFRNWIFREFKIDVPFQQLLAGSLTILELAQMICK